MRDLESILQSFQLEPAGENRFRGSNVAVGHGVLFGGQVLGQAIVAALASQPDKTAKTVHTVFARGGSSEAPVDIEVEAMSAGRSVASSVVSFSQAGRLCTRSVVLMTAAEPDLIRHSDPPPGITPPPPAPASGEWEVSVVDGVDINDPDAVGPARLDVWTCFPGAPADAGMDQPLLAYATDGFLIGTAMRPHAGVGQALAHRTLSTAVLSHTLTFHESFSAADWMLLRHEVPHTGGGRGYGRAHVFRTDGALVASFVQDSMIRARPDGAGPL
ncbi:MAG TPA: acyl-CoA thioesterase domain-containing protein [Acidimicrobiales bacterium]|jgi:acyl-CoA thioesterase|nr:acyl-CoA thioesterase domain-containing protein [Acidimicrobiales bacterium]